MFGQFVNTWSIKVLVLSEIRIGDLITWEKFKFCMFCTQWSAFVVDFKISKLKSPRTIVSLLSLYDLSKTFNNWSTHSTVEEGGLYE